MKGLGLGKVVGTLAPIIDSFDADNCVVTPSGIHHRTKFDQDILKIVGELLQNKVFQANQPRKYKSFPNPRRVLHAKSKEELNTWIKDKSNKII